MKLIPMKVEEMGLQFLNEKDLLSFVGHVAGECYNSSKDLDKCIQRALNCIKRGHHSPFEHANITHSSSQVQYIRNSRNVSS